MLHSYLHHNHQFLFTNLPISLTPHHFSSPSPLLHRSTINPHIVSAINPSQEIFLPWLNKITTAKVELGNIFDAIDDSSSNQVTFSVVLSVAIAVLFFPTIQRRIKRAKQLVYYILCFLLLKYTLFFIFMQFMASYEAPILTRTTDTTQLPTHRYRQ